MRKMRGTFGEHDETKLCKMTSCQPVSKRLMIEAGASGPAFGNVHEENLTHSCVECGCTPLDSEAYQDQIEQRTQAVDGEIFTRGQARRMLGLGSDPKTVLEEAGALVYGDRQADYGHPRKNMQAIADFWNTYLHDAGRAVFTTPEDGSEPGITASDVATMLLLMKVARLATGTLKRDTVADMAGYVAVLARTEGLDE